MSHGDVATAPAYMGPPKAGVLHEASQRRQPGISGGRPDRLTVRSAGVGRGDGRARGGVLRHDEAEPLRAEPQGSSSSSSVRSQQPRRCGGRKAMVRFIYHGMEDRIKSGIKFTDASDPFQRLKAFSFTVIRTRVV